jgi:hypothetical protein
MLALVYQYTLDDIRSREHKWTRACHSKRIDMGKLVHSAKYVTLVKFVDERALVQNLTAYCLQLLLSHGEELTAAATLCEPKTPAQAVSIYVWTILETIFHVKKISFISFIKSVFFS